MSMSQSDMDFCKGIMWKFVRSNNIPAHVDKDDLLSDAYIGFLDAQSKYDASKNPNFKSYAYIRVRGAMIDGMRSREWLPRRVLKQLHDAEDKSAVEVKKTYSWNTPIKDGVTLGDTVADTVDPYAEVNDVFYDLINLIKDDNDRAFMQFRYIEHMTFGELAEIFGRTESCMSLWHSRIIKELQNKVVDPKVDVRE